jgi:transcriptional regulator with XRE-family HTH domain
MAGSSRSELGDFLRSRREKLRPEALGLTDGRRRRTPGLKREEVAELAGIGIDWYVRLEQGRTVSPSMATIDALARALRLDEAEHAHLRELARSAHRRAFSRETVPELLRRMIQGLSQPAYITGRRWDILAWNAAAADVFCDFSRQPEEERNILLYVLTHPDARRLFGDTWAREARRIVAQFRATHDFWAEDPAFLQLLEQLHRRVPEFATWWESHDIRGVAAGRKLLNHPTRGPLRFEYASFQSNDDPSLKLVIYTPV